MGIDLSELFTKVSCTSYFVFFYLFLLHRGRYFFLTSYLHYYVSMHYNCIFLYAQLNVVSQ